MAFLPLNSSVHPLHQIIVGFQWIKEVIQVKLPWLAGETAMGSELSIGLTVVAIVFTLVSWKVGYAEELMERLFASYTKITVWLNSPDARFVSLSEKLAVRAFYGDLIETEDGWLWAGAELIPV